MTKKSSHISWLNLSRCLASMGTPTFISCFTELLQGPLSVMQCMIFAFRDNDDMKCLLSLNFQSSSLAVPLAGAYIKEGYRNDPNLADIMSLSEGDGKTVRLANLADQLSPGYREKYFNRPGIVDKASHILKTHGTTYYINFYRGTTAGPIDGTDLLADDNFVAFLATLLSRHFEDSALLSPTGPLAFLSDRERQVCGRILKGQKTEQIAHDMGLSPHTIITYRKRAYRKLGISSRGELFLLCG